VEDALVHIIHMWVALSRSTDLPGLTGLVMRTLTMREE
jgi:hypothetical protein